MTTATTTADEPTTAPDGWSTDDGGDTGAATTDPTGAQVDDDAQVDDEPGEDEPAEDDKAKGKAGREAARYRRQLRTVEAERDTLAAQVEALQRSAVLSAATGLAVPADLLDVGHVEVADLLDEHGQPDPEKVRDAVAALVIARPGLRSGAGRPRPDPLQGPRGTTGAPSWSDVLGGRR